MTLCLIGRALSRRAVGCKGAPAAPSPSPSKTSRAASGSGRRGSSLGKGRRKLSGVPARPAKSPAPSVRNVRVFIPRRRVSGAITQPVGHSPSFTTKGVRAGKVQVHLHRNAPTHAAPSWVRSTTVDSQSSNRLRRPAPAGFGFDCQFQHVLCGRRAGLLERFAGPPAHAGRQKSPPRAAGWTGMRSPLYPVPADNC